MDVEALTLTSEDKQKEHVVGTAREEEIKESVAVPVPVLAPAQAVNDAAKAKEVKPAGERKRTRNLSEDKRFKIFSGTANRPLTEEIGRYIGVPVGEVKIQRFADGEVYFQLLENVQIGRAHV